MGRALTSLFVCILLIESVLCDDWRVKRSDDHQQLEVVVQDLAQQVSANKAEILALKAQLGTSASLL